MAHCAGVCAHELSTRNSTSSDCAMCAGHRLRRPSSLGNDIGSGDGEFGLLDTVVSIWIGAGAGAAGMGSLVMRVVDVDDVVSGASVVVVVVVEAVIVVVLGEDGGDGDCGEGMKERVLRPTRYCANWAHGPV